MKRDAKSRIGPSRHFAATKQFGRSQVHNGLCGIGCQLRSVEIDPKRT
jgi:hypothetical protein